MTESGGIFRWLYDEVITSIKLRQILFENNHVSNSHEEIYIVKMEKKI